MKVYSRYVSDFDIRGMRYYDGAMVITELEPGMSLSLIPEDKNLYDPDAVAIYYKNIKLGYIPKGENSLPSQLFRFGHNDVLECRVLKVDKYADTWGQIRVGIYMTDKTGKED